MTVLTLSRNHYRWTYLEEVRINKGWNFAKEAENNTEDAFPLMNGWIGYNSENTTITIYQSRGYWCQMIVKSETEPKAGRYSIADIGKVGKTNPIRDLFGSSHLRS